jgi:hypothetical protein
MTLRPEVAIPPRPATPDCVVISESSLMVTWACSAASEPAGPRPTGLPKQSGYRVQYARFRDGAPGKWTTYTTQPRDCRLELLGLQPGVTFVVRVAAVNSYGRGQYSSVSLPVTTRRLESVTVLGSRQKSPSPQHVSLGSQDPPPCGESTLFPVVQLSSTLPSSPPVLTSPASQALASPHGNPFSFPHAFPVMPVCVE